MCELMKPSVDHIYGEQVYSFSIILLLQMYVCTEIARYIYKKMLYVKRARDRWRAYSIGSVVAQLAAVDT